MLVSEFAAERNLTAKEITTILNARGVTTVRGNKFRTQTIASMIEDGKNFPDRWLKAFDVEASPPILDGGDGGAADPGGSDDAPDTASRRRETPPKRPAEAQIEVVDAAGAKKRIAWAYKFVGTGLAAGSGSQGVAHVWADQSEGLAQMWLDAAKDSPWAARVVTAASAGGPMGELVAAHVYLAGATAYVLGAGIPGGDAVFAKYSKYRPTVHPTVAANGAAPPPPPAPEAPAEPIVVPVSAE